MINAVKSHGSDVRERKRILFMMCIFSGSTCVNLGLIYDDKEHFVGSSHLNRFPIEEVDKDFLKDVVNMNHVNLSCINIGNMKWREESWQSRIV